MAGTNYKLRLKASDGDSHTRYEAVVYGEGPLAVVKMLQGNVVSPVFYHCLPLPMSPDFAWTIFAPAMHMLVYMRRTCFVYAS